jgi:hypothetical protein
VIRSFFAQLPAEVDVFTRHAADADLAGKAAGYRPDELSNYAQRIMDWLHPDGQFSDQERARKRGITLGTQDYDGMSRLRGLVTPQLRATIEPCWPSWPPRGDHTHRGVAEFEAEATAYLVAEELQLIEWDAAESRAYIQTWLAGREGHRGEHEPRVRGRQQDTDGRTCPRRRPAPR